jgi:hypothetical protein
MLTVRMFAYEKVMAFVNGPFPLDDVISYLLVGLPTALRVSLLVVKDSSGSYAL